MKKDIILAGVGGQGIISIAAIIGTAAVNKGWYMKQSEVHGMSQRGGDVMSNLRISENPIASDLIPKGKADLIISVEPMEGLRYLPMISKQGWLITSITPFINITNYPDPEKVLEEVKKFPHHIALDAEGIARDLGSTKAANIVMLGAASPFVGIEQQELEKAIQMIFGNKGQEIIDLNINAFRAGLQFANEHMND